MNYLRILFCVLGLLLVTVGLAMLNTLSPKLCSADNITKITHLSTGIIVMGLILLMGFFMLQDILPEDTYPFYIFLVVIGLIVIVLGGILNTTINGCTNNTSLVKQAQVIWSTGLSIFVIAVIKAYLLYKNKLF